MPKRPKPSPDSNGKDEVKKARVGDNAAGVEVKQSVPLNANAGTGPPLTALASTSQVVAAGRPIRGMPPSARSAPKSQRKTTTPSKKSSNGSVGVSNGNSFLKSLRSKSSATTNNGDKAKKCITAGDAATAPMKTESNAEPVANNNSATTPSVNHPMFPFPHLPLEKNEWLKTIMLPLTVFLLFLLNMAVVSCITSEQSRQSVIALKRNFELNKLQEELAASTDEVNILRGRVNEMEKVREARERMLADDSELFTGLFGPMVVGGGVYDDLLTREERNEWLEKLRILEANGREVTDKFNKNLVEFGGVEGAN